jgi:tetratricopeptide (TPR) repeat protein
MIFISYRITDSLDAVRSLNEGLTRVFGSDAVFWDKSQLQGGHVWTEELENNAKHRKVMLVVIGPKWHTATASEEGWAGVVRLFNPNDWVRKEITLALDAGNIVIPILLNGAAMPGEAWLRNCGLHSFYKLQSVQLTATNHDADLAALVALVREYCPELDAWPVSIPGSCAPEAKKWTPSVLYPLQPAPHFTGREELLNELTSWVVSPSDPTRVRALVAAGGTGKTALAEKVLASLPRENPFGVFVWSFYEDPKTEAFLRAACRYFLGDAPKETGGLLERLQNGLRSANLPHLLILDGLELVQATGTACRTRGELEDQLMKRFLRWLAAGRDTSTRALITSRFPLPDLADWKGHGFCATDLTDLDVPAARAVFRKWGVKGSDATVDALADSVHRHALTVDVLASYLGTLHGGDPTHAPAFDPEFLADTDLKTAKLHRVLTSYAEQLADQERDLLARLSVFPRGVGVELLCCVARGGKTISGSLKGCTQSELTKLLERLRMLGLVFRYEFGGMQTFTAHPFLRDFFEKLLGVEAPRKIHETVQRRLTADLNQRPKHLPTDPVDLDKYQQLIEHACLAGNPLSAFAVYSGTLGGKPHLAWRLGEYSRGLRLISGIIQAVEQHEQPHDFPPSLRATAYSDCATYSLVLGNIPNAMLYYQKEAEILAALEEPAQRCENLQNQSRVAIHGGCFWNAIPLVRAALDAAKEDKYPYYLSCTLALLGELRSLLGQNSAAMDAFTSATRVEEGPLIALRGVQEAEFRYRSGQLTEAQHRAESNMPICAERWQSSFARCAIVLSRVALASSPSSLAQIIANQQIATTFATRSGHTEVTLQSNHLDAEIARHEKNFSLASSKALDGIHLADSCGFGRWSLDIRIELSKIHLAAGEPEKAIEPAEWVLKRSQEPDCQYAWGIADSLHLLGVAHARLGHREKAREYLRQAIEKRKPLEHPQLAESESELAKLTG